MEQPEPVLPFHVMAGRPYWAAFGDKRWSAVTITTVKRKWAKADRVNPSSNQVTKRGAKVKVAELIKREPKLKGKDKPEAPPSEVFARSRELEKTSEVEPKNEPKPEVKPKASGNGKVSPETMAKLLALLDDDSTIDDW